MTAKQVFITGAAAGIGRATALAFARLGDSVGAYDIDEAGLAQLKDEIERAGGRIQTGHLDVTDASEVEARIGEFAASHGDRLDVLVNNAGILLGGKFEEIDVKKHHREIDINVKGVVNGLHAAFPYLRRGKDPVAINLASASAIYGQPELANYSATKFFIRGLTEALDLEWGPYGIRVVAIWPLFVQTAMTKELHTGTTASLGIKLGPEDVAATILRAARPKGMDALTHSVHYTVGTQTRLLAAGSHFSPAWLTRLVNKRLAKH